VIAVHARPFIHQLWLQRFGCSCSLQRHPAGPADADLHQILADDQLTRKVSLGLPQVPDRRHAGYDVVDDQGLGVAVRRDLADAFDPS